MERTLFFGTYTAKTSEGIYTCRTDEDFHPITGMHLAAKIASPTYCILDAQNQILYAVCEPDTGRGALTAWHVEGDSLTLINRVEAPGAGLVHLCFDSKRRFLFTVSYRDASVLVYRLEADGSIGLLSDEKIHTGHGVNPKRQEKAHAHSVWLTPDEAHLCVCDLGIDKLVVYEVDYETGKLTGGDRSVAVPDGFGPRHLVFHPDRKHAYLLGELASEVQTLEHDDTFHFTLQGRASALDGSGIFSEAAAIRISGDGRFLYTSNRGQDSIAVFGVAEDGSVRKIADVPTGGKHPRDFIISKDGSCLLAANRDTDNITVFHRDAATGMLEYSHEITGISMPVCIVEC